MRVKDIQIFPYQDRSFAANIEVAGLCEDSILLQYTLYKDPRTNSRWSIPTANEMCWRCEESQSQAYLTLDANEIAEALLRQGELDRLKTVVKEYDQEDEEDVKKNVWFYEI